jgi:hypothetical protein
MVLSPEFVIALAVVAVVFLGHHDTGGDLLQERLNKFAPPLSPPAISPLPSPSSSCWSSLATDPDLAGVGSASHSSRSCSWSSPVASAPIGVVLEPTFWWLFRRSSLLNAMRCSCLHPHLGADNCLWP